MKEKIEQIRQILNDLESVQPTEVEQAPRDFSAFELPEIIQDIVDYLMPILESPAATIYWYAFRHSILANGYQYVRLSNSGIPLLHKNTVRRHMPILIAKGILQKESDPTLEGTLYKVMIPEEIEECRKIRQEKEKKEHEVINFKKEADFYNVRENRIKIYERDMYKCNYCNKQLTQFTATLDHVMPVVEGGDNSYENLITACRTCNSQKSKKSLGDFLADQG